MNQLPIEEQARQFIEQWENENPGQQMFARAARIMAGME